LSEEVGEGAKATPEGRRKKIAMRPGTVDRLDQATTPLSSSRSFLVALVTSVDQKPISERGKPGTSPPNRNDRLRVRLKYEHPNLGYRHARHAPPARVHTGSKEHRPA